ncbi:hypothetical protein [Robiginitomaculum antarcticum]|uniref:hypothetical protein n=1 Tax=Robiginitomaculum antarcticum TaxID=437507 RepID=UPI00037B419C|nr:hypothetical protein [Robiginitomaculum antarcticum]
MDESDQDHDDARDKQRDKERRAKARKARAAKRKLERLSKSLEEVDDLTDWEAEFSESLSERLEKFDSGFVDPEKGGRNEALSYAQKKIFSQLRKKDKDHNSGKGLRRSSFKSKGPKFSPRVRQLDDDFEDAPVSERARAKAPPVAMPSAPPPKGKPFLRIVKPDEQD